MVSVSELRSDEGIPIIKEQAMPTGQIYHSLLYSFLILHPTESYAIYTLVLEKNQNLPYQDP